MNKIAAGEVIERPASVVKELVENSIDAGSTKIDIEIEDAGLNLIKITDNGSGIPADDLELAFKKHTTSKLHEVEDLDKLTTLGFRGEALPSIASVSRVELLTKIRSTNDDEIDNTKPGKKIYIEGGKVRSFLDAGCPEGTIIKIMDLFYNVPARKKFLKKPRTEAAHITDWVMRFAIAYPSICFRLVKNGSEIINTPATGELLDAVASIFGSTFARALLPIEHSNNGFKLDGYLGKPSLSHKDRSYQFIYVNGRFVSSNVIERALSEAYHSLLMKHKYPSAFLNIKIDPAKLDVNIHPTKIQVRFMEENEFYPAIVEAVKDVLVESETVLELGVELETKLLPGMEPPEKGTAVESEETGAGAVSINTESAVSTAELKEMAFEELERSAEPTGLKNAVLLPITHERPIKGLPGHRLLAQLHDSYILVQTDEGLLIVDQHALHERVMYEKLKKQYESKPVINQELIVPAAFEFNSRDYEMLIGYSERLKELGFEMESFGKNTIRIRTIPTVLGRLEDRNVLNDILDDLLSAGRVNDEDLQRESIIQIMSCKAAVKAGEKLSPSELSDLMEKIPELTSPYHCAHGRPTILSLPFKELEKQFKRTG